MLKLNMTQFPQNIYKTDERLRQSRTCFVGKKCRVPSYFMSFLLRATRKLGEYLSKFNSSKTEITSSDFDNHLVFFLVSLKKWFLPTQPPPTSPNNWLFQIYSTKIRKFIPQKQKGNRITFQHEILETGSKNFVNNIKKQNSSKGLSNDTSGLEIHRSYPKISAKMLKKAVYSIRTLRNIRWKCNIF